MTPYDLSIYLTFIHFINSACMFIACHVITAPFGKFSKQKGWGPLIPAHYAWAIMESPNVWISLMFIYHYHYYVHRLDLQKLVLFGLFISHYIHRSFIYPYFASFTKPNAMPLSVMILAFLFCCFNSITQCLALLYVMQYRYSQSFISILLLPAPPLT